MPLVIHLAETYPGRNIERGTGVDGRTRGSRQEHPDNQREKDDGARARTIGRKNLRNGLGGTNCDESTTCLN